MAIRFFIFLIYHVTHTYLGILHIKTYIFTNRQVGRASIAADSPVQTNSENNMRVPFLRFNRAI